MAYDMRAYDLHKLQPNRKMADLFALMQIMHDTMEGRGCKRHAQSWVKNGGEGGTESNVEGSLVRLPETNGSTVLIYSSTSTQR